MQRAVAASLALLFVAGLLGACAAGMLLLYLGSNVPGLGLFVRAFSTLAGLGALILNMVPGRSMPPPLPPAA